MWKRHQRREGLPQAPGQLDPNICFLCWCGCKARGEGSERQTCTEKEHTEDQHLSLDEVIAWPRSFQVMLRSTEGRDVFLEFLRSEYREENLMFWITCEELKKETNSSVIAEKARIIYRDFISIFSPKVINLDSWVRDGIMQSLSKPSSIMFEEAQLHIYNFMRRNLFPRFLNSAVYRDLLNSKKHNALTKM
ncbi:regulator of G-protein signaling 17-like [Onychostoma macrolepis]|uniref:regulator of G-protein signaling 17-like n=1 Tax=Onychostoma macrolepis TaxID=369639 RepID=UPI00272D1967|nr:regulator of G-protein signaling 17-like [Onychostoma macrolepis]